MEEVGRDFIVELEGHECFLCLKKILSFEDCDNLSPEVEVKVEVESGGGRVPVAVESASSAGVGVHSFQSLARYLKLDLRKLFRDEDGANADNWNLKVELCTECALVNERFSELHSQFEKIQLEMASFLKVIKGKLEETENEAGTDGDGAAGVAGEGKRQMFERLRGETFKKCTHKLRTFTPRIPLERLGRPEQEAHSEPDPDIDVSVVKLEFIPCYPSPSSPHLLPPGDDKEDDDEWAGAEVGMELQLSPSGDIEIDLETIRQDNLLLDNPLPQSSGKGRSRSRSLPLPYTILPQTGHFQCNLCPSYSCPRYDTFRQHHNATHLQLKLKCDDCGKEFQHRGNYYRHRQRMHEGIRVKCAICNKSFPKGYIDDHRRETHGLVKKGKAAPSKIITKYTCPICGNEYKHSGSLRNHRRKDHSKKLYA